MRIRISRIVLWLAWTLFVLSLFCPAVIVDMGAWNRSEAGYLPGFVCAMMYSPYYPSNAAIALAPALLWIIHRLTVARWPQRSLATLFLLSGIGALFLLPMFWSVDVGYVLWVASFFLASIGAWLDPPPQQQGGGHLHDEAAGQSLVRTPKDIG